MNTENRFITTWSGQHFYFCNSGVDVIYIDDIAQALSNLCRFTGTIWMSSIASLSIPCWYQLSCAV